MANHEIPSALDRVGLSATAHFEQPSLQDRRCCNMPRSAPVPGLHRSLFHIYTFFYASQLFSPLSGSLKPRNSRDTSRNRCSRGPARAVGDRSKSGGEWFGDKCPDHATPLPCVTVVSPVFSYHPRSHTSLILNHSGLQWVNHSATQVVCGLSQQGFVYEISFRSVWQ